MAARLADLAPRAALLDGEVYLKALKAKEATWPARAGAGFVLGLGLALGLVRAVGGAVAWSAAPAPSALKRVLLSALDQVPLLHRIPGAGRWPTALAGWDPLWRLVAWSAPPPLPALALLPAVSLGLLAAWLCFGLAAHGLALRLGGRGHLAGGLRCLALAEAPRAILLVPMAAPLWPALIAAEAWVLAARFQALKAAYGLDGWVAFWAALGAEAAAVAVAGLLATGVLLLLPVWGVAL